MVGINEDHMDLSRIPTASAENEVGTFLTFTLALISLDLSL
jgi:hypothetical protein